MAAHNWLAKDFYAVLGVPHDSTEDSLKRAYRRLVRQHHPDTNAGCPVAEDRFKEVGAAYAVLSDRVRRAQYDRTRHRLNTSPRAPRTSAGARPSSARPENPRPTSARPENPRPTSA
ncbi:MAG: DnaJ domain-containing protein, partial [Kineosporiaceae bacterium]